MIFNVSFARHAAVLAGAFFVAGCTTESETSGYSREIRIDAFSHFWATTRERGEVLGPQTIVMTDVHSEDQYSVDTLRLLDPDLDKTAGLPSHKTGRFVFEGDSGVIRLFYQAASEPKGFECYLSSTGVRAEYSDGPARSDAFYSGKFLNFFEGEPVDSGQYGIRLVAVSKTVAKLFDCGYAPGLGFYLGSLGDDYYADHAERAGSEIVIRY